MLHVSYWVRRDCQLNFQFFFFSSSLAPYFLRFFVVSTMCVVGIEIVLPVGVLSLAWLHTLTQDMQRLCAI